MKNWKNKTWRYYHFTYVYHKWQSYDVWLLRYGVWQTEFLSFWTIFCLSPPKNLKNQNFEKMKKRPGDIIILLKCTENHDHTLYCSWYGMWQMYNCYFSLWAIFFPFTPVTAQKMNISKKWNKKSGDIIILHICTKNYDHNYVILLLIYNMWQM